MGHVIITGLACEDKTICQQHINALLTESCVLISTVEMSMKILQTKKLAIHDE